jgi:ISXO2-like transposase domain
MPFADDSARTHFSDSKWQGFKFWALVKRGLGGVYHSVAAKHLQGYLNEYTGRYHHRSDPRAMFDRLVDRAARS